MMNKEAIEIYVHIPFCERKCAYCDFTSFVCNKETMSAYFDALIKEIETAGSHLGRLPVVSCFFGGGTPSVPEAKLVCDLLCKLKEKFVFLNEAEISIEVNPNSATPEKLLAYRQAGFNRLSIGLQSTHDSELKSLSRLHDYETFLLTYDNARKAGFDNINIDLMSAIPGQTMESYKKTLERVCELNPEHISAYSLIIEPGTPFFELYGEAGCAVSEDIDREMYAFTKEYLGKNGYRRYEISNYAKEGYECRHNVGYWTRTPYIGFGVAAASLYKDRRYAMHENLKRFIEGDFSYTEEKLSKEDVMSEFMFLGLRCISGISKDRFFELFNKPVEDVYAKEIEKLSNEGLLINGDRIRLTDRGLDLANYCMSFFVQ